MSEFDPGYELVSFLVQQLRQDAELHALLFQGQTPALNEWDVRVYESGADLVEAGVQNVLPRVLVAVELDTFAWEQSDQTGAPCSVWLHHFAARDESVLVQKMAKATDDVIEGISRSPVAVSTRIMVAQLTRSGPQVKDQQPAFDEARRITNTYATRLVGVLA